MAKKNIKVEISNHTFELRNIQVAEFMSEETLAFHCDIYIDGVKCGYCKNSGQGEGNYPMVDREYHEILTDIEAEAIRHKYHCVAHGKDYTICYSLDFLIGMMVDAAHYENKSIYTI